MVTPDALVDANGQAVELNRITDAVFDDRGELDEDATTFETVEVAAIVSDVTEQDLRRIEGRVENPSFKMTVGSDVDIAADREGRPDRVRYTGRIYEVAEVRHVEHPFADATKQTVILESAPGRASLDSI